jgi:hypothetical protein
MGLVVRTIGIASAKVTIDASEALLTLNALRNVGFWRCPPSSLALARESRRWLEPLASETEAVVAEASSEAVSLR